MNNEFRPYKCEDCVHYKKFCKIFYKINNYDASKCVQFEVISSKIRGARAKVSDSVEIYKDLFNKFVEGQAQPILLENTKDYSVIVINWIINNPYDSVIEDLDAYANLYLKGDYTIDQACQYYNEDNHSNMPLAVFKAFTNCYQLFKEDKENNKHVEENRK